MILSQYITTMDVAKSSTKAPDILAQTSGGWMLWRSCWQQSVQYLSPIWSRSDPFTDICKFWKVVFINWNAKCEIFHLDSNHKNSNVNLLPQMMGKQAGEHWSLLTGRIVHESIKLQLICSWIAPNKRFLSQHDQQVVYQFKFVATSTVISPT